jgi:hypothetical protein
LAASLFKLATVWTVVSLTLHNLIVLSKFGKTVNRRFSVL